MERLLRAEQYAITDNPSQAGFIIQASVLEAGITDKLLTTEDKDSEGAKTYANVVAVRAGDEERPEIKALVEALKSDTIRAFIEEKYGANVIPMF